MKIDYFMKSIKKNIYIDKKHEVAPYKIWGNDFEPETIEQLVNACSLPITVRGALMPDAHLGYGLPIGGVIAVKNAVIPYAVGVDIACRMKMTVLNLPIDWLVKKRHILKDALSCQTRFGVGAVFNPPRQHKVMDEDWTFSKALAKLKDKAYQQLGTSGSGNHFVEYGILTIFTDDLKIKQGQYLALLSHSGSRGTGNCIATHYSKIAMQIRADLPQKLKHLAWLDMDSDIGSEYFAVMNLMGRYAAANHQLIHNSIASQLGAEVLLDIENHHNFAWQEYYNGQSLYVHRKGATPAALGAIGIIPGSMAAPGYIVKGKGNADSINSASHGAGRKMSRKAAKKEFNWNYINNFLKCQDVELISAGLDEAPMAYKDIEQVMDAQSQLVDIIARFNPKIVKMAPSSELPED